MLSLLVQQVLQHKQHQAQRRQHTLQRLTIQQLTTTITAAVKPTVTIPTQILLRQAAAKLTTATKMHMTKGLGVKLLDLLMGFIS